MVSLNTTTYHPQRVVPPIILPPTVGVAPERVDAPGLYPLEATSSSVTVKWYDRSDNETGFNVFRRDAAGAWQLIYQTATRDQAGSGSGTDDYAFVDISTALSGQCYMITAYNSAAAGNSVEECTVRPDPSRFPQSVASAAPQWSGLSDINDGTGVLENTNLGYQLVAGNQTFGVSLVWAENSLWKIEAQGGPELMKGQAVALKVWDGGWLKHGKEDFGVDLQLSSTPVYEWYAIGLKGDSTERTYAGAAITDGGTFACTLYLYSNIGTPVLACCHRSIPIRLRWHGRSATGSVCRDDR